jgi:hypothetical protein
MNRDNIYCILYRRTVTEDCEKRSLSLKSKADLHVVNFTQMSLDTSLLFPLIYMVIRKQSGTNKQACDDTRVTVQNLALNGDAP